MPLSAPVIVTADDTDIYVLLLHSYISEDLVNPTFIESPQLDRTSVEYGLVLKNRTIVPYLIAALALIGADKCAPYHGIKSGIKCCHIIWDQVYHFFISVRKTPQIADVIEEATLLLSAC